VDVGITLTDRSHGDATVVVVEGEIDVHTAPDLRERLLSLIGGGVVPIVDLSEVGFLDSSGLGALAGVNKQLETHGNRLRIVCADPKLVRLFSLTRLDEVLTLHPTIEDATGG
jgi:anti-sigma B factor antagonist